MLLGRNPEPLARGRSITAAVSPTIDAGLPSALLRRRPDIAQAEYQLVAADHSLESSRDQLLPTLKLSTSATLQGLSLSQLVDAPSALWSVGASVLAPVLQRSRLQAGVDVAAAQRDQALFAYEETVRRAFTDVEDALTAIDALESQRSELDARTVAASEVLRIARSRYRNGYASYLEELDVQRAQYAAQQSLIQARAALLSASVDLYRASAVDGRRPPSTARSLRLVDSSLMPSRNGASKAQSQCLPERAQVLAAATWKASLSRSHAYFDTELLAELDEKQAVHTLDIDCAAVS